ncbi:MAG: deoxyribodipyrimidine photo-lyase [Candidatus Hydrothermales bacterium]
MYRRSIYWFKRDLRIEDNGAFFEAHSKSEELIPIFIFIPELLEKFKSNETRLGFVIECVKNLSDEIKSRGGKLFCFYEDPLIVIERLILNYKSDAVFTNRAFSWSVEKIEKKIELLCKEKNIPFHSFCDNFLVDPRSIPYTKVYSAFYKKWEKRLVLLPYTTPKVIKTPNIKEPELEDTLNKLKFRPNLYWKISFGFERLEKFDFHQYDKLRNRLDLDGTSKLSPYIRFGVISLRKLCKKALENESKNSKFVKELAWREFWYHIKLNFPELNLLEFQEKRRGLNWQNDEKFIKAFMEAKTGYPIVDAAIIQLKEEGWMHNRARMIVANFLTKDLLVDWRIGEKFFMDYLIDYDEVVNVGNWQWCASVGTDPKPLRIFNPIKQAKKFDPEGLFIKKYIPDLKNIPPQMLHDPIKFDLPYYKTIVNHYERALLAKEFYSKTLKDR